MNWSELQLPQDLLGSQNKPLHLTGRLDSFRELLTQNELFHLDSLIPILVTAAQLENSILHILLIGSAAAIPIHQDVDLLICSSPNNNRIKVARRTIQQLTQTTYLAAEFDRRKTANKYNSPLLQFLNLHIIDRPTLTKIDTSFLSITGGNWEEVLDFHQRTRLAHSIVI